MLSAGYFGCTASDEEPAAAAVAKVRAEIPPLRVVLEAKQAEFAKSAPEEVRQVMDQGLRDVAASGVLETALKEGATATDFELPNALGETVRLSDLLKSGPVVLTWYRGGWCPYCNLQLHAYNKALPEFQTAGGQLVAISPEIPDSTLSTSERQELKFEVLSDVGNKVAEQYGVAYTLPAEISELFKGQIDLAGYNGDHSNRLPLAVTYVIDTAGTIRYAFVDADYRKRAEPTDILRVLREIKSGY
jgi:peroxiredoxin